MAKITNIGTRDFRAFDPTIGGTRGRSDVVIPAGQVADLPDELAASLLRDFPRQFKKGAAKVATPDDGGEAAEEATS